MFNLIWLCHHSSNVNIINTEVYFCDWIFDLIIVLLVLVGCVERTAVLKKHIFRNIYRIFVELMYPLNYPLSEHYHLWSRFTNYWLVCKASSASSREYFNAFTTSVKLNELCAEQIDIQWWVCWGWEYLWWTIIVCRKFSIKWYTNSEFYVHKSNQRWRLYFKVSFSAPNHGNK